MFTTPVPPVNAPEYEMLFALSVPVQDKFTNEPEAPTKAITFHPEAGTPIGITIAASPPTVVIFTPFGSSSVAECVSVKALSKRRNLGPL